MNRKIPAPEPFDAEAWARSALAHAPPPRPETLRAVAGFALVWNLFEGVVCERRATVAQFEKVAKRFDYTPELQAALDGCLAFYQFRYASRNGVNARFDHLYLRRNDRRPQVEAVLRSELDAPHDKMLAILIIAYRIRNNLFHGLKTVQTWDDQAHNISHAAKVLSLAIGAHGL